MSGTATNIICKQPGETINASMDFSNLVSGSSITLNTPSVTSVKVNGNTTDLTIGSPTVSGQTVIFSIAGGTHKTRYRVEVTVNTSDSEIVEGDGILVVSDK